MSGQRLPLVVGFTVMSLFAAVMWWILGGAEPSQPIPTDVTQKERPQEYGSEAVVHLPAVMSTSVSRANDVAPEAMLPDQVAVAMKRVKQVRQNLERENTTLHTVARRANHQLDAIAVLTAPTPDQIATLKAAAQKELDQLDASAREHTLLQSKLKGILEERFDFGPGKKIVSVHYNHLTDYSAYAEFFGADETGIIYGEGDKVMIKSQSALSTPDRERYDYILRAAVEEEARNKVENALREQ